MVVLLQSTKMMDEFMRLAKANTTRNLETCGVLAGSLVRAFCAFASHLGLCFSLTDAHQPDCYGCGMIRQDLFGLSKQGCLRFVLQKKGIFYVCTLIIPKQESTSDSVCVLICLI